VEKTMKRHLLPLLLLGLFACQANDSPVQPELAGVVAPSLAILDGSREGGNPGFLWLPPIVPHATALGGELDESLLPFLSVEICEWDGAACVGEPLAVFTSETEGAGRLHISDGDHPHYIASWETHGVDQRAIYRVSVKAGPVELGYADVDLIEHGYQAAEIDQDEFVVVGAGWVLPVAFLLDDTALPSLGVALLDGEATRVEFSDGSGINLPNGYPGGGMVRLSVSGPGPVGAVSQRYSLELLPLVERTVALRSVDNGSPTSRSPALSSDFEQNLPLEVTLPYSASPAEQLRVRISYPGFPEGSFTAQNITTVDGALLTFGVTAPTALDIGEVQVWIDSYFEDVLCTNEYEWTTARARPAQAHVVFVHGIDFLRTDCEAWQGYVPEFPFELFAHLDAAGLDGNTSYHYYTYPTFNGLTFSSSQLATEIIDRFDEEDDVVVVAHSLGGLVARGAVEFVPDAEKLVDLIITLGSPLRGTKTATVSFWSKPRPNPLDRSGVRTGFILGLTRALFLDSDAADDARPDSDHVRGVEKLSVPLKTFAGQYDASSPCLHDRRECLFYQVISDWQGEDSDGFVEASSARFSQEAYQSGFGEGYDHSDLIMGREAIFDANLEVVPDDPLLREVARLVALEISPGAGIPRDLIAHYPFNGTANDLTTNRLDGELLGNPTFGPDRFGQPGNALVLDGIDDFVSVPDDPRLDIQGPLTLAAWINLTDVSGIEMIVNKLDNTRSSTEQAYELVTVGSELRGSIYDNLSGAPISEQELLSRAAPGALSTGWHHVALTFDGGVTPSAISLFVDGEKVDSVGGQSLGQFVTMRDVATPVLIGAHVNTEGLLGNFLQGSIDEVMIHGRALTPQEVADLCDLPSACDQTVPPQSIPPILFSSNRAGNQDLYAINPDGTGLDTLTTDSGNDDGPLWSPDGSMIAFSTDRYGNGTDIAVMDVETGAITPVLSTVLSEWPVDWAPDGQSLVIGQRNGSNTNIWVVNLDGTGLLQLTNSSSRDGPALFSPDGQSIVFRSDPPGFANTNLFRINVDGSNQTLLMNWRFTDGIEWVPGANALFVTGQEALGAQFDMYRLDFDGNVLTRLTTNTAFELAPTSSPDAQTLLFARQQGGSWDLYLKDLITLVETPLVVTPGFTEISSDWRR
jgi:pimeloyl-ACP methyl ester carboxylesterase